MSHSKVYWSQSSDWDSWEQNDFDWMVFVLIPRKWWSLKAWKFANSFRAHLLKKLMGVK